MIASSTSTTFRSCQSAVTTSTSMQWSSQDVAAELGFFSFVTIKHDSSPSMIVHDLWYNNNYSNLLSFSFYSTTVPEPCKSDRNLKIVVKKKHDSMTLSGKLQLGLKMCGNVVWEAASMSVMKAQAKGNKGIGGVRLVAAIFDEVRNFGHELDLETRLDFLEAMDDFSEDDDLYEYGDVSFHHSSDETEYEIRDPKPVFRSPTAEKRARFAWKCHPSVKPYATCLACTSSIRSASIRGLRDDPCAQCASTASPDLYSVWNYGLLYESFADVEWLFLVL
ncbi:hypothetical protein HPP92_006778 [Vanilla planifolia]|uniref:Uncharacterized protein n=1 Tax=Vanilla planifolia TaxID=51239 RepID=A0A835RKI8_VANPL|nr:hypothetical protein HPP92_006778 [Vanilla planifolia]